MEGASVPAAKEIAERRPRALNGERGLVIETFGGPFSPLNETELQLALIRALAASCVLVSSTTLGCIGRTLQCLTALRAANVQPIAVVLLGQRDPFAESEIAKHAASPVFPITPPEQWAASAIARAAQNQAAALDQLHALLNRPLTTHHSPLTTAEDAPLRLASVHAAGRGR